MTNEVAANHLHHGGGAIDVDSESDPVPDTRNSVVQIGQRVLALDLVFPVLLPL